MTIENDQVAELTDVQNALQEDPQRIGDVFRAMKGDVNREPQAISDELGLPNVNSIYSYKRLILTLLEERRQSNAPTVCGDTAIALRSFVKRHRGRLSPDRIRTLEELEAEHRRVASNPEEIARENQQNEQLAVEPSTTSTRGGIYVYSYPHYLKYPVLPIDEVDSAPRTYLKVGKTTQDAETRVRQQNTTEIPEPPVFLRHYTLPEGANLADTERILHNHLSAVDHNRVNQRRSGAGSEWFLTHLTAVDSTAALLNLSVEYEHEEW